jgi:hypothetical protein
VAAGRNHKSRTPTCKAGRASDCASPQASDSLRQRGASD